MVLNLKKNEIKSLKQEPRKTIFFVWYLDGLFLSSFQKIPSSNVRFIDSRRNFTNFSYKEPRFHVKDHVTCKHQYRLFFMTC